MSISHLVKILVVMFAFLAGTNVVFSLLTSQANNRLESAAAQRILLYMAVQDLQIASRDLTRWARAYAVTGNLQEYNDFWNEIIIVQRRERAVATFTELNAPQNERDLIQQALNLSNELALLEEQAFSAVAEDNMDLALYLMFGEAYEAGRLPIMQTLSQLSEVVEERTRLYQEEAQASASFFEGLAITSTILFAILSITGVIIILRKISPINGLVQLAGNVSKGDLNVSIDNENISKDEIGQVFNAFLKITETLKGISSEVQDMVVAAAVRGDLHYVIEADKYSGEWREIMNGLNNIAKSVDAPIVEIRDVMSDLAHGNFNHKVVGDYKGDFLQIKNAVNNTIDALSRYVVNELKKERETHELVQVILDSTPLLIEFWDENANMIDCNQRMLDIFEMNDKNEFMEHSYNFSTKYQPGGKAAEERNIELINLALEKGSIRSEWTFLLPNGEELPTETTWIHVTHQNKSMIIVYSQDLRPVKEAMERERKLEMKLREQEMTERIQLMFDATPLVIEYWNRKYEAIECNKTALDFHGFPDKKSYKIGMRETSDYQSDGTSAWKKWDNHLEEIFQSGSGSFEFAEQRINGDIIIFEVDGICVNLDDEIVVITYSNDVTQLRKLQEEQQRIEIAEESSKAKSRFLARMSHELRTPIAAVMGVSEIQLQNPNLPPDIEESFAKILHSANMLHGIINDILDLSKIEAGKMELLQEEYEVASMIADVAHLHFSYLQSKDVKFSLYVDENLPIHLIGDILRIEQIMNNLLSNAFKYTEHGSVVLSFQCQHIEAKEGCVTVIITVQDTGFGMAPEQLNNLRNEYTRFHEREHRFISGTGLGMPIVYSLAQMMDANIDMESEVGIGTKVVIHIPQKVTGTAVLGKELSLNLQQFGEGSKVAIKRFAFTPEPMPYGRVLVVDDVEANLYVAKGLLSFYHLNIETCNSGHEAVNKIKAGNVYDIVFMDYMMPGINGIEAMHKIRDTGYTHPIVVLTANAMIGQAEEFIKSGFDSFISKPIQTKYLNTILIKFIRDKQLPEVIEAAKATKNNNSLSQININEYQNSCELIKTLRIDFAKSHKNTFNDFCEALRDSDNKKAHLLVHTIKGAAGLIEEDILVKTAAHLEIALAEGRTPTSEQLSALENEISRVVESIGKPEEEDFSGDKVLDTDKVQILFDKLSPLLKSRNAESLSLTDELRTIPETAVLVKQIENFDFDLALKTMDTLNEIFF